jgi:hypothetical protein
MRRKAHNRLWTLILSMLLCGASLAPGARIARADTAPTDPVPGAPSGDPQAGDPDSPDTNRSLPAPGGHRGSTGQTLRSTAVPQGTFGIWLLRLRMAFASATRFLFRF